MTRRCYGRDCQGLPTPDSGTLSLCADCWHAYESTGKRCEWYLRQENQRLAREVKRLQGMLAGEASHG